MGDPRTLIQLFETSLLAQAAVFRELEAMVPAPSVQVVPKGWLHRYAEQTPEQAIVAKLARCQSILGAALLLLKNGFVQEQGILERCLDASLQDVNLLAEGIRTGKLDRLHEEFLRWFWYDFVREPADEKEIKYPGEVPRRKVFAFLMKREGMPADSHTGISALKKLLRGYSAYVHGSIAPIMELYGGKPPRFHVAGMLGTPRVVEYERDLWNYFFRSAITLAFASLAFDRKDLFDRMHAHKNALAAATGQNHLIEHE